MEVKRDRKEKEERDSGTEKGRERGGGCSGWRKKLRRKMIENLPRIKRWKMILEMKKII